MRTLGVRLIIRSTQGKIERWHQTPKNRHSATWVMKG
jgi:hypothetical protein